MKLQVLGSGCSTCQKLYKLTQLAVTELKIKNLDVEYVSGVEGTNRIIELGLMSSPVLTLENKVILIGFIPDIAKIKRLITEALE